MAIYIGCDGWKILRRGLLVFKGIIWSYFHSLANKQARILLSLQPNFQFLQLSQTPIMHTKGCGISTKAEFNTGTQLHPAGVNDIQKMQQHEKKAAALSAESISPLYCMDR